MVCYVFLLLRVEWGCGTGLWDVGGGWGLGVGGAGLDVYNLGDGWSGNSVIIISAISLNEIM